MPENAAEMVDSINAQPNVDADGATEEIPSAEESSKTFTAAEVDAKIKARIDKQNARHAEEVAEIKAKLEELEKHSAEVESERDALREQQAFDSDVHKVASETGLPADVVRSLRGQNYEELLGQAAAIKSAFNAPVVRDSGEAKAPTVTKESILAIKNEKERLAAIRANAELFTN